MMDVFFAFFPVSYVEFNSTQEPKRNSGNMCIVGVLEYCIVPGTTMDYYY